MTQRGTSAVRRQERTVSGAHHRCSGGYNAFLALLVWVPVPLGSNRPWAWAILEIWVFVIAAIWLWQFGTGAVAWTRPFLKAKPVLIIFVIWLGYGLLQLTPVPTSVIRLLSPSVVPIHAESDYFHDTLRQHESGQQHPERAGSLSLPAYRTFSLDVHASFVAWLKSLAYVLVFSLSLLLVDSQRKLEILAWVLVWSAVAQAVFGSFVALSDPHSARVATGTFINRNHFAAYLVMGLSIGFGLLLGKMRPNRAELTLRQRLRDVVRVLLGPKARLRVCLALMVVGLVLTRSRMGNVAFLISMMVAGSLALVLIRNPPRAIVILLVSLVVIDMVIVGTWFGVEEVEQRLAETSFASDQRDEVSRDARDLWQDYLLLGAGAGSFYATFPRYRRGDVVGFNYHAHNDYLQLLAEAGLIGFGMLAAAVMLSLAAALSAQRTRENTFLCGLGVSATMGILAMLMHSSVEFNLQIPANAVLFMVLLAFAWQARYLK